LGYGLAFAGLLPCSLPRYASFADTSAQMSRLLTSVAAPIDASKKPFRVFFWWTMAEYGSGIAEERSHGWE